MFHDDREGGGTPAVHPVLRDIWQLFEDEDIAWCLLRAPDSLESPSGDIDILVRRRDMGRVANLLKTEGFTPLRERSDSSRAHYVRYDKASDCILWFHLVSSLSFGPNHAIQTGTE